MIMWIICYYLNFREMSFMLQMFKSVMVMLSMLVLSKVNFKLETKLSAPLMV